MKNQFILIFASLGLLACNPPINDVSKSHECQEVSLSISDALNSKECLTHLVISERNLIDTLPGELMSYEKLYSVTLINQTELNYSQAFGVLERIPSLNEVKLEFDQGHDLPLELCRLNSIKSLIIRFGQDSRIPGCVFTLKGLKELFLLRSSTKLDHRNDSLKKLTWLDSDVTELGRIMGSFPNLDFLDVSENKIDSLPNSIEDAIKLQKLIILDNPVVLKDSLELLKTDEIRSIEAIMAENPTLEIVYKDKIRFK